jgi:transposase
MRLVGNKALAAISGEVKDLRREACDLKALVADLNLENRLLKEA